VRLCATCASAAFESETSDRARSRVQLAWASSSWSGIGVGRGCIGHSMLGSIDALGRIARNSSLFRPRRVWNARKECGRRILSTRSSNLCKCRFQSPTARRLDVARELGGALDSVATPAAEWRPNTRARRARRPTHVESRAAPLRPFLMHLRFSIDRSGTNSGVVSTALHASMLAFAARRELRATGGARRHEHTTRHDVARIRHRFLAARV